MGRLSLAAGQQLEVTTEHLFHAGMYSRTLRVPCYAVITGALMKRATVLIVHGFARFLMDDDSELWVDGCCVLAGSAGRKTLMVAYSDVQITMIFPTTANSVEEAEREFTDEWESLLSRNSTTDTVLVTGE